MGFDPLGKTKEIAFAGAVRDAFKHAVAVLPEETRKAIAAMNYDIVYRGTGSRRVNMAKSEGESILACPLGVPMAIAGKTSGGFAPGSGENAINQWARVGQITNDQASAIETDECVHAMDRFISDWDRGLIPQEDLADLFSVAP